MYSPEKNLKKAEVVAENYYKSTEFLRQVEEIYKIIKAIRAEVVAFDIEGTMISLAPYEYYGFDDLRSPETGITSLRRLRRPLANEILEAFNDSKKEVFLWTGQKVSYAKTIVDSAGLKIPDNIYKKPNGQQIVGLEFYEKALESKAPSIKEKIKNCTQRRYGEQEYMERLIFADKVVKIPCLLGVEGLIDDYANKRSGNLIEDLYGKHEVKKLIDIDSFEINDLTSLNNHHTDTGLLTSLKKLVI